MWLIQTFGWGNLICFPVSHVYFFVGEGAKSILSNWIGEPWSDLPPGSATVSIHHISTLNYSLTSLRTFMPIHLIVYLTNFCLIDTNPYNYSSASSDLLVIGPGPSLISHFTTSLIGRLALLGLGFQVEL